MKKIVVSGVVSSGFQLIGAVATQSKLQDIYGQPVGLRLRYFNYWSSDNTSQFIREFIEEEVAAVNSWHDTKIFHLSVNHRSLRHLHQVVIDDGVAAYRLNPVTLSATKRREDLRNRKPPMGVTRFFQISLTNAVKILNSLLFPQNNSVFKRSLFSYFSVNQEMVAYYLSALEKLSNRLPLTDLPRDRKIVLILTQPYDLLGFRNKEEYAACISIIFDRCRTCVPECLIILKRHPIDQFDYSTYDVEVSEDDGMPAEILIYQLQDRIEFTAGFSSTTLLIGRAVFGIPSYYILPPGSNSITSDFWVNYGFRKHLKNFAEL